MVRCVLNCSMFRVIPTVRGSARLRKTDSKTKSVFDVLRKTDSKTKSVFDVLCSKYIIIKTNMIYFSVISAFVTAHLCCAQAQSTCTTPSGRGGVCTSIFQCKPLWALIDKPNRTPQEVDLLKRSHCGFRNSTPQVCCPPPPCYTPDGKEGQCIDIYSCAHIADMLRGTLTNEQLNFVKNSKCQGPNQYSVCCGFLPDNQPTTTVTTTLSTNWVVSGRCTPIAAPPDPQTECCGRGSTSMDKVVGGIIGGAATGIDQYPWLAIIEYKKNDKIKMLCGGALISGRYVLTAGHCVVGPALNIGTPTNVRLGEYDLAHDGPDCVTTETGAQDCIEDILVIPIERTIPHPDYKPNDRLRRHDIALIRMTRMAPYTDTIRPICLPAVDVTVTPPKHFSLYAAGWSAVEEAPASTNFKLHVKLPFQPMQQCQKRYSLPRLNVTLWRGQLCAGGDEGKDSCKGASGGPLMHENGSLYEAIGIVSFGPTPCGLEDIPGVYTKVYEYDSWIRSNITP